MLTTREANFLRKKLEESQNPLFIHDDDADGLASFLLLYRAKGEGRGKILKAASTLDERFIKRIGHLDFDCIFILDVPDVTQEFIDQVKVPVYWIDHHQVQRRRNVKYYNPRKKDDDAYFPTTRMAYQIANNPNDLWIAMTGCLADWHLPDFIEEFSLAYPDLLAKDTELGKAVFASPMSEMVRLFFFILKGSNTDVEKSIKILTRIRSPLEILNEESPAGKFLHRRFLSIDAEYQKMLKDLKKKRTKKRILLYEYDDTKWSFTANLANEAGYRHQDKVVIIARSHNGQMKCSLRAQFRIVDALQRCLAGIDGARGGGHPTACGAVIPVGAWKEFLKQFEQEIAAELEVGVDTK